MKVANAFEGRTLLITGCTGFLGTIFSILTLFIGKIVLEKFLRCIPHVKKIYVLVRPKVRAVPPLNIFTNFFII